MSLSIPISVLPVSPMYDVFRTTSLLEPLMKNYMMSMSNDPEREREIESLQGSENEFRVNMDVQQFHPDQLSVKVVDNSVIINGKHEERQDEHGYISREFTRRYVLPDTVDPAQVVSSLSSDGVLTISAPKKVPEIEQNERVVPIVKTN